MRQNVRSHISTGDIFEDVVTRRLARRSFLKGALLTVPLVIAGPGVLGRHLAEAADEKALRFKPIALDNQDRVLVAEGYDAKVLIRWGDPVFRSSPIFDPFNQSKVTQEQQFGYNCDYVSYLPLSHDRSSNRQDARKSRSEDERDRGRFDRRSNNPERALLFVNHEYTNEPPMAVPSSKSETDAVKEGKS